jgi:agmatine/peptidylarginine deiminase
MSESVIEFVENWVDEKIEKMDAAPTDIEAQAKTLAAECVTDAQNGGLTQSDITDTFDDLAAFIAAEIEEAFDMDDPSDEHFDLVDDDDARLVDGEDDDGEDDKKDA